MLESTRKCPSSKSDTEGREADAMQNKTSTSPGDVFLCAAAGSIALAVALQATGRRHLGIFIGQWTSPLLILGLYNKFAKSTGDNQVEYTARARQWDREAAAETIVEPDDRWSNAETAIAEDEELPPYREHIENEFGVHSISDYPHDERFPSSHT